MGIRKSSTRKLLSLSAFGAGAAALGTGEAYASIHYSQFPANTNIGFQQAGGTSVTNYLKQFVVTNAQLGFKTHLIDFKTLAFSQRFGGTLTHHRSLLFNPGLAASKIVSFAVNGAHLAATGFGATWNNAPNRKTGQVNFIRWTTSGGFNDTFTGTDGAGGVSNGYALFRFPTDSSSDFDYGWLEYSLSISPAFNPSDADGPNMNLVAFAYDDSGAFIHAGDTGVPEPSTFDLSGLSALMLGAAGVRRWRKAKSVR